MWGKIPKTVKCPRGDCEHYNTPRNEHPCKDCTCCYLSESMCKSFCYKSKILEGVEICEIRKRAESRVVEPEQTAPTSPDKPESRPPGETEPG